jgi:transcriptional regulator with XRE-family HTH domain
MKKSKAIRQRGVQEADKVVGQRIRARRNQQGLGQAELGNALGVTFQQIQKYEKGTNRVSTGRLVQICEALECSITDLAEGLSGKDAKITPASQFAASRDGVAIIDAMSKIADLEVRRQLINLAEKLAS